jgi:sialic acid synthase SpsE/protoporphyrinogen oxidase
MKKNVIILGAGPVGLISGWLLSNRGWHVNLYEAKSSVGGMCRSWKWDDFIVDTGPHIFHTPDKKLWNFWKKEFGSLLHTGKYWAKNTYNENFSEFYDYPLSIESIKKYDQKLRNKILKEIKDLSLQKKSFTKNFKEHVAAQVGSTLTEMFFSNYPQKVWGIKTENITSEWAPKRIKFRKKIEPFFSGEYTAVGKYGTGSIYNLIKDKILKNGGKFFLNHAVINLKKENLNLKEVIFNNSKKLKINNDDIIISSLPITYTSQLLGSKSNLKFRGVRSVFVSINKPRVLPTTCHWVYYSSKNIIFNRVSEHKLMSKFVSPMNKTYLTCEISYSKNDHIDRMDLKKISKIVSEDLVKVGLVKKEDILKISDNKENFVYPVQFTDYKYELSKAISVVEKYNNFFSLGTGGEFNYSDSQIIFHKVMDLVANLDSKESIGNQVIKDYNNTVLNEKVKLGKHIVGDKEPVFIIAEAGLNHNGDYKLGKRLIDEAKKINCNAIKFQSFDPSKRVSKEVKSVKYSEKADGLQEDIFEMFSRLSLSKTDTKKLFDYANKKKIDIFSTPFDLDNVDYLEKIGVKFYKLASVDLVNIPLIKKIGLTKKPLIMSTGMSNLGIVEDAVEAFKKTGNNNLILLHCLSSYPANEKEMNLNAIKTLKRTFNIPVGLSDHYPGIDISLMSIGLGANIIERHFTLDKSLEGPDHILSSEPEELNQLIKIASQSNLILGDGQKRIQPSEYLVINTQRKSLYAAKNLKVGDKLSLNQIIVKGPGGGILPKYISLIENRRIRKAIKKDHPITWENI